MTLRICILTLAVIAMGYCNDDINAAQLLANGNNKFTANLFSEVAKNNVGKSFVLSPFSVLTPLAQLSLASEGESHDELLNAIGLLNDESLKLVFTYMNKMLKSMKGIDLKMASKIYVADGYSLNDNFAALSREITQSDFANIDFTKQQLASEEINSWVENKTNHRIKNLVDPQGLSEDTRALLVNAIYFKGRWKKPFDRRITRDEDFHLSSEKKVTVPMMSREGRFYYSENAKLNSKVLGIPFKGDESIFYIILPNSIDGLLDLQNKLKDPSTLDNALKNLSDVQVQAFIPRFKIETKTNLKDTLTKIGVEKIFGPTEANLNKLLNNVRTLYVSDATQKAFIEINEEGGEATAANDFYVAHSDTPDVRRFVADHPFVFLLKAGEDILFNGVLSF